MGGLLIAGGVFLAKKGADFALGKAKAAVQNKVLNVAKGKAAEAFFGKPLGVGDVVDTEHRDFRGLQMYKEAKPKGFFRIFSGSHIIAVADLNSQLRDQAIQSFDLAQKQVLPEVLRDSDGQAPVAVGEVVDSGDAEPGEAPVEEQAGAAGPAPKDAVVPKVVNKPITLDDFRSMVTIEEEGTKRAKNKGYVRFVKCDDGQGVKLGKVGNKVGWLINWRTNVTREHNRQMRLLFAETLLADFGGLNGVSADGDLSRYGAALQEILGDIRRQILNVASPGDLLKRTTVRECIEKYDAIFGEDSLKNIADSFMKTCLDQCAFTSDSVADFLGEYGKYAPEGLRDPESIRALVMGAKDGKSLKAALVRISEAFGKMNEVWQQDKAARGFLAAIVANPTTAKDLAPKGKTLDRLRGSLLRRMAPAGAAQPSNADVLNLFLDRAFPAIVDSIRQDFLSKKDKAKPDEQEDVAREFAARLSLEGILREVEDFAREIREKTAPDAQVSPMRVIIQQKEEERAEVTRKLEAGRGKDPDLEAELVRLEKDLAWLAQQEADFKEGKIRFSDDFREEMEKKALAEDAEAELKRSWSKDGLMSVLFDGYKTLDATFQRDYAVQDYLRRRCPNIAYRFNGSVKDVMADIVAKFEGAMTRALAANVRDKGDISPKRLIEDFADFLMFDVDLRDLRSEEALQLDANPGAEPLNARHTAPLLFVESLMRAAVNHAVDAKAAHDEKFADRLRALKGQTEKLVKVLADLFTKVKKGKLADLSRFVGDLRSFSYKGILKEESVQVRRDSFLEGVRQQIFVRQMTQFIENDIPDLLAETDVDKFRTAAQHRLDLRVEESMSTFLASYVQQFYEGTLHFTTSVVDEKAHIDALSGLDVVDKETGYTNPVDVAERFQSARAAFDVKGRLADPKLGRSKFRPLADEELVGLIGGHAERLWRQNVVSHAPGRHKFAIIDLLINKFQNFLNVSVENRRVDISTPWLDQRAAGFTKDLGAFVSRYASFEKRLVTACRAEVTRLLEAGKDARFAAVRDHAVREQLVDDVLGAFSDKIADALRAFIANPKAFARTGIDAPGIFGNDTRLVEYVRDVLGTAPRGETTDVTSTAGYGRIAEALGDVVQVRRDFIEQNLARPYDVASFVMDRIDAVADEGALAIFKGYFNSGSPVDKKAANDAVAWAVDRALAFARSNPVEAYAFPKDALVGKMGERALAELAALAEEFKAQFLSLRDGLGAAFRSAEIPRKSPLEEFAVQERARILGEFVVSFCDLAVARTQKDDASLKRLVADTVARFRDCIESGKTHQMDIQKKFYSAAATVLNQMQHDGDAHLLAHGATADVLLVFHQTCDKLWSNLPDKLKQAITSLGDEVYDDNKIIATLCRDFEDEVRKQYLDFADRLDRASLNFTTEGVEKLLALKGIVPADHVDHDAFVDTVQALREDPRTADFFVHAQVVALTADAPEKVPEEFAFLDQRLVPAFRFQYQVRAARNRVDGQIAAAFERLDAMMAQRNVPAALADQIRNAFDLTLRNKASVLDVKMSVDDLGDGKLKPDEINIDVTAAVDEIAGGLDERMEFYQLDLDREEWLKAHLDVLVSRAFSGTPLAVDAVPGRGPHAQEMADVQRKAVSRMISDSLQGRTLAHGGVDDWNLALADMFEAGADKPLTEDECRRIDPHLSWMIGNSVQQYQEAVARDKAEQAIRNRGLYLAGELDRKILVESLVTRKVKLLDAQTLVRRMVASRPKYLNPAEIVRDYARIYGEIPQKTIQKGKLPAPATLETFVQALSGACSQQLEAYKKRLLAAAEREGMVVRQNTDEDTAKALAALYGAVREQVEAQQPGSFDAFRTMLDFMLGTIRG